MGLREETGYGRGKRAALEIYPCRQHRRVAASQRETTRERSITQSSAITQTASPPARAWFDLGTKRK
jgi:hypothetical protein